MGIKKEKIKISSDTKVLLIILAVIAFFIFGLEPMYKFIGKIRTGTLFEKPIDITPDEPAKPPVDDYTILKPVGASNITCTLLDSSEDGDRESSITLYYTSNKLRSIVEKHIYSGMTEKYSNYILSEQNRFKERKNLNLDNHGYSVELELTSTSELTVSSVYILEDTTLDEIKVGEGEALGLFGNYDDNIFEVTQLYGSKGYRCNW